MRYYLDCEFDGHSGPLLSLAMVSEEGLGFHASIVSVSATDPWVRANVEPLTDKHDADVTAILKQPGQMGGAIRSFIELSSRVDDDVHTIVADAPGDIARFCAAIGTGEDGSWTPTEYPRLNFEYHNVEPYPTTLPGAVQHNAWWDAMALREKLSPSRALDRGDGGLLGPVHTPETRAEQSPPNTQG